MKYEKTIFDKIIEGTIPSKRVWEDEKYLAVLTPYPNTPGFTVVMPKENPGDNYLSVDDDKYIDLLLAAKKVAGQLKNAFKVNRVGLIIEGEGVPYLHVKLIPMIDQVDGNGQPSSHTEFYKHYPGYLTTIEGPEMSNSDLEEILKKIKDANR